ncbi:MAG: UV DNA damage repair endonuclease UvsE [Caldisericia bacterium]|nr:UV DNA damage repair endonuclease UvsE [Caldisericia bacterium]
MKIGYPCINYSIGCSPNKTFRLTSYEENKLRETIRNNLLCLIEILKFNLKENLKFFRISSETIPFASHEIMSIKWYEEFKRELIEIGDFIKKNFFRISMHPDQFILINSIKEDVFIRSVKELEYHMILLDSMELDYTHKVQIHVGGVYGDKNLSIERFLKRYESLPDFIKKRLCIENDDKYYSVLDVIKISNKTEIPIIFDYFHYRCNNNGEKLENFLKDIILTWKEKDGIPMVDYSSQDKGAKKGTHARRIDLKDFEEFINITRPYEFDIMLEIKDKEKSAIEARKFLEKLNLI